MFGIYACGAHLCLRIRKAYRHCSHKGMNFYIHHSTLGWVSPSWIQFEAVGHSIPVVIVIAVCHNKL